MFAPYRSTSYKNCINTLQNAKQSEYIENLEKNLKISNSSVKALELKAF